MSEIAQYIVGVIVIPAVVAAVLALPFAVRPLRENRVFVEGGIACALMAAFVVSFTNELGWTAILRQIVTVPNDDAPFERWHRVGLVALALGGAAWVIAATQGSTFLSRLIRGLVYTLTAATLVGVFVRFPAPWSGWQIMLACTVCSSIVCVACMRRGVVLWSAWITFGVLAFMSGEAGFASLAVMSGAASAGAFAIALLWWIGGRRRAGVEAAQANATVAGTSEPTSKQRATFDSLPASGAIAITLGTLTAVVAMCGRAYDTAGLTEASWLFAALLPGCGLILTGLLPKRVMQSRWGGVASFAGIAVAAVIVVAIALSARSGGDASDSSSDQELRDMYGG
jgi:hypothetical protein